MENWEASRELILSLNRALLGAVFPQLRAALVRADANVWRIRFYVDGEISNGDRESLTVAGAEVAADLHEGTEYFEQIVRLDAPSPIPKDSEWVWVYARKE